MARLLALRSTARRETELDRLDAIAVEVDDLAAGIARHALNGPAEPRLLGAATVTIEAARSTVRRAAARPADRTSSQCSITRFGLLGAKRKGRFSVENEVSLVAASRPGLERARG